MGIAIKVIWGLATPKTLDYKDAMGRELASAADVIEALGGISAVAKLTKSGYRAAANWKSFNAFPPRTYVAMKIALTRLGHSAPPELWRMVPSEAAE